MLTLYSKDFCPYCTMAKNLLTSLHIEYEEIDITDRDEIMMDLVKRSGMRTVPQIYTPSGKCLGGYTDISSLHSRGELMSSLD